MNRGIYVASKTKHAPMWIDMRARGWPIISTWIDEAGVGETVDFDDLWTRCTREVSEAAALLAYHEEGEVWKGAFVEVGVAFACQIPIYLVGSSDGTWMQHHSVTRGTMAELAPLVLSRAAPLSVALPQVHSTDKGRIMYSHVTKGMFCSKCGMPFK